MALDYSDHQPIANRPHSLVDVHWLVISTKHSVKQPVALCEVFMSVVNVQHHCVSLASQSLSCLATLTLET